MYLYYDNISEPNLYFYNKSINDFVTNVDDFFLTNANLFAEFAIHCIDYIPDSFFFYPVCFGNFENLDLDWPSKINPTIIKMVKNKQAAIMVICLENESVFKYTDEQINNLKSVCGLCDEDIIFILNNTNFLTHRNANMHSLWLDEIELYVNNSDLTIDSGNEIKYYFESLTNNHKHHRYVLSEKIYLNNISCQLSYLKTPDHTIDIENNNFYHSLPILLSEEDYQTFVPTNKRVDETISHYKTAIHIINESFDFDDLNYSMFLTEKTLKPIIVGRPFLINGPVGSHHYLETLGYKKHSFINYDFDLIDNSVQRLEKLWEEIQRLHKLTLSDILRFIEEDKKIIKDNYDNFQKRAKQQINHISEIIICQK